MWQSIWHLILQVLGKIENNPKLVEHDVAALPEEVAVEVLPEVPEAITGTILDSVQAEDEPPEIKVPTWKDTWELIQEIINRPFDGPLHNIPSRRYSKTTALASGGKITEHGVYDVFGRPSKESKTSRNKKYRKARQKVHEDLPGTWNNAKPRLYMEVSSGQYLREALGRAQELEERISDLLDAPCPVLSSIVKMGSYKYRHISRDPSKPLSNHSWSIALDVDSANNRGVRYARKWQRRVKRNGKSVWIDATPFSANRGPINKVLPFSQQYFDIFPNSVPFELVMCFKSVGFSWGGDWGRSKWHRCVEKFEVGFDQESPRVRMSVEFKEAINEWNDFRFYDGMHFELFQRGEWARSLWSRQQNALRTNMNVA